MQWDELSPEEHNSLVAVTLDLEGKDGSINYCTDIAAAWRVIEKMKQCKFSMRRVFCDNLSRIVSMRHGLEFVVAWPDVMFIILPEDICIAALVARGYYDVKEFEKVGC
jgi:hypothetical protein